MYVELPEIDQEVGKADTFGAVESVKSASDLFSPVAGKIVETNSMLEEKPSQINKDPEGEGWIAKFELAEGAKEDLDQLMSADAYLKHTEKSEE